MNPWPLRYRYSALPTELTSQLGAGDYVGYTSHPAYIANMPILNIRLANHLPVIVQRRPILQIVQIQEIPSRSNYDNSLTGKKDLEFR